MDTHSLPAASTSLLPATDHSIPTWEVVLRTPRRVVVWNATTSSLAVSDSRDWISEESLTTSVQEDDEGLEVISQTAAESSPTSSGGNSPQFCPLCLQPTTRRSSNINGKQSRAGRSRSASRRKNPTSRNTSSYFALLSEANSRANTPRTTRTGGTTTEGDGVPLDESTYNSGYFSSFFVDIKQLGKGASGTVRLVRHMLNGEELGLYAVKTIAIGSSSGRLPELLREIHLLESLQHRNLVTYHHSWVETCRLSPYGPPVPALYVLMSWANGGSLQSYIDRRRGEPDPGLVTREERVRRFRTRNLGAVHLLRLDEILSIFEDCCQGLGFLHDRNILHLDLKADNVLLHWDEDALLPCAKISDLGSSISTGEASRRNRTGASGTLDWCPPESWDHDPKSGKLRSLDRATDLWALGLILHLLAFFTLPYHSDDPSLLEKEIQAYPGFLLSDAHALDHGNHIPQSLLRIIARLVNRTPSRRLSCEEVIVMLQAVREKASSSTTVLSPDQSALVQQRTPSPSRSSSVPLVPAALPSEVNLDEPLIKMPPTDATISPPSVMGLSRQYPIVLIRSLIALICVFKAISIQRCCPGGGLSSTGQYAILLPVLLDLVISDFRMSFALGVLHLMLLALPSSLRLQLCIVQHPLQF